MQIFDFIPVFNRYTGEPDGGEYVKVPFVLDDYSGIAVSTRSENRPICSIKLNYDSSCEEDWYYDEVDERILKNIESSYPGLDLESIDYDIRRFLAESPFHFAQVPEGDTLTILLQEEFKGEKNENDITIFGDILRKRRQIALCKAFESGYNMKKFGFGEFFS